MTPLAVMLLSQVLALSECVAVAVQLVGGPATTVTLTVTFCDGVKPCKARPSSRCRRNTEPPNCGAETEP